MMLPIDSQLTNKSPLGAYTLWLLAVLLLMVIASGARASQEHPPVIFTIDFCPSCLATKALFDDCGIEYIELNLDQSEHARDHFASVGGRGIPLVFWKNLRIPGFQEDRLRALLEEQCHNG